MAVNVVAKPGMAGFEEFPIGRRGHERAGIRPQIIAESANIHHIAHRFTGIGERPHVDVHQPV